MGKYNEKNGIAKPTAVNEMGEAAFNLTDKEELVSTVMTTFLHDGYYENEKEIVDRIRDKMEKVNPLFSAKLAIYARNTGNMRSVTHLIAASLARMISGKEWPRRFYDKIITRPDDMTEILSAYANMNNMPLDHIRHIPNAMKKGFRKAMERLSPYQIDKYKMRKRKVKMVDMANILHPKPSRSNMEAYRCLVNGLPIENLHSSRILEREMSRAGEKAKSMDSEEKDTLKKEAIVSVLDNIGGMPEMNLLRNMRNILLYAPDMVDEACRQLTIREKVLRSRLLPFRFATAYGEIENMAYDNGKDEPTGMSFENDDAEREHRKNEFDGNKAKTLNAIEDALEISCENIPRLDGNCAILVDHSGSVRGDSGGESRISAFSSVTTAMIGNLFASMVAYRQDNVYIGLFGDRLIPVKMDRNMRLLDFNRRSYDQGRLCGPDTESGIYDFMRQAVKEKKKIDNLIVFSDCQIGDGGKGFTSWYGQSPSDNSENFSELFNRFRKINPQANFIVVNINQTKGTSVFDGSRHILNVAGWSDKIFDIITSQCKGWTGMINEIEKIEI